MRWAPRALARDLAFPEGPVYDGDGVVTFTEIRGTCVSRVDAAGYAVVARTGGGPNGATRGADGTLYVANNGGLNVGPHGYWHSPEPVDGSVQRVGADGTVSVLASGFDAPKPHRPNDICFGPDGALYVTDPANWEDLGNLLPGRVWRIGLDGRVDQVAEVPHFCNGLAFGPDGRLYVAQSIAMAIVALDWTPSGLGDPKPFATLPIGFPDGFCFTASGDLIVCGSMGDVIQVFDPDGTLKQTLEPGTGTEPTNCCIGDGSLYVTLSGTGELVATEIDAEPHPLYDGRTG